MQFKEFRFIYISLDYLRKMHEIDPEVFFVDNTAYEKKPHLGILITEGNWKYVIPLTSAKPKHASWENVTATNYRIYEIINMEKAVFDKDDIIVDIRNKNILSGKLETSDNPEMYKQRILSILEIKKMFPIIDGAFTYAELDIIDGLDEEELHRRILMQKEYQFCVGIRDDIQKKASKIYKKQMDSGKVLKFHCNFKKLETMAESLK
ncbi:MAG: type III toxin-antitoxin system ToxN/AbiQ family toxin [Lachnospiraceae bacterium]|nr:type III toxin-antitoxin system ToxN/AbiQ family toxin [Lachnospiraceae bacterium]